MNERLFPTKNSVCIRAESNVDLCSGGTRRCILKSTRCMQYHLNVKQFSLKPFCKSQWLEKFGTVCFCAYGSPRRAYPHQNASSVLPAISIGFLVKRSQLS